MSNKAKRFIALCLTGAFTGVMAANIADFLSPFLHVDAFAFRWAVLAAVCGFIGWHFDGWMDKLKLWTER